MHAIFLKAFRSPLIHFIGIGLALFVVDHWLQQSLDPSTQDPYTINVSSAQQLALQQAFQAEHGRRPNQEELDAKLAYWLEEQMLSREAMALGLDKSDTIVRRQLALKMRLLLAQREALAEPSEDELNAWLVSHGQRYGSPENIHFEQIFLSRGKHGDALSMAAEKVQLALQASPDHWQSLSDPFISGLRFENADYANLRQHFGQTFAESVLALQGSDWQGPLASNLGLHFIRITARTGYEPAQLDNVRAQVMADFRRHQEQMTLAAALKDIKARYRIHYESSES